jgi:serine/threonine protein kinase
MQGYIFRVFGEDFDRLKLFDKGGYSLIYLCGMTKPDFTFTSKKPSSIIKILNPSSSKKQISKDRSKLEARILEEIKGSGIDIFEKSTNFFNFNDSSKGTNFAIKMPYLGQNLEQVHQSYQSIRKNIPLIDQLLCFSSISNALSTIHQLGIIHRDVKQSNIVCLNNSYRLIDYGVSKADLSKSPSDEIKYLSGQIDHYESEGGIITGTPSYMPIEQINLDKRGIESDIYSYCVMMYEIITNRNYFEQVKLATNNKSNNPICQFHFTTIT